VPLFRHSEWTLFSEHVGIKIFLLAGLRDKEILAALQTGQDTIVADLELNFSGTQGGFPMNSKLTGIYI